MIARHVSRLLFVSSLTSSLVGTVARPVLAQPAAKAPPAVSPSAPAPTPGSPRGQIISPAPPNSPASASAPLATPTPQNEPPIPIPPPPDVNDPMLAPVSEPTKRIATWQQALQLVKSRSTTLQISYDEILRAQATAREALALALPQLNAQGSYNHQLITTNVPEVINNSNGAAPTVTEFTTPTRNVKSGSINGTVPLFNMSTWQKIGTARAQVDVNKLAYQDVKRTIALAVANALVQVVTAERVAELNRVSLRNALELLDLTQRKTNLGSGTGLDVIRAQQQVETTRSTLVSGDESLRQTREALGLALGIPEQIGVERNLDLNGLEQSAHDTCHPAKSLDERADIAADHERVHVAERTRDNAWLQFLPSATLSSTVTTSDIVSGLAPPTQWNILASITVPIWDGGTRYGLLRDARAQIDEAQQNLEGDKRTATVQVTQAQRNVQVAEKTREVAANARQLAAENDRLTRVGYVEGKYTSNDLVLSATALRQTEITLAVDEFGVVQARVAAILALATCAL